MTDGMVVVICTAAPLIIAAIIWFIRLEGKVKTQEKVFELFQKQCDKNQEKIDKAQTELFSLIRSAS